MISQTKEGKKETPNIKYIAKQKKEEEKKETK